MHLFTGFIPSFFSPFDIFSSTAQLIDHRWHQQHDNGHSHLNFGENLIQNFVVEKSKNLRPSSKSQTGIINWPMAAPLHMSSLHSWHLRTCKIGSVVVSTGPWLSGTSVTTGKSSGRSPPLGPLPFGCGLSKKRYHSSSRPRVFSLKSGSSIPAGSRPHVPQRLYTTKLHRIYLFINHIDNYFRPHLP